VPTPPVNPLPTLCRLLREPLPGGVQLMAPDLAKAMPMLAAVLQHQEQRIAHLEAQVDLLLDVTQAPR
jgi:hypothetical protein